MLHGFAGFFREVTVICSQLRLLGVDDALWGARSERLGQALKTRDHFAHRGERRGRSGLSVRISKTIEPPSMAQV